MEGRSRRKKKPNVTSMAFREKMDAEAGDAGDAVDAGDAGDSGPMSSPKQSFKRKCSAGSNASSNKKALQHPTKPSTHPPSTKLLSTCKAHRAGVLAVAPQISEPTDDSMEV